MDYWLSEQEQLVQSSFHDYLAGECAPHRVRTAYDTDLTFDKELWRGFAELGFTGACIPVDSGGSGLGMMEAALIAEELGRHAAPLFLEGHILAGLAVSLGGTSAQQQRLLPKLATKTQESIARLAFDLIGSDALLSPSAEDVTTMAYMPKVVTQGRWLSAYFDSLATTLGGGTSNMQRNAIGEQLLGLPRDRRG